MSGVKGRSGRKKGEVPVSRINRLKQLDNRPYELEEWLHDEEAIRQFLVSIGVRNPTDDAVRDLAEEALAYRSIALLYEKEREVGTHHKFGKPKLEKSKGGRPIRSDQRLLASCVLGILQRHSIKIGVASKCGGQSKFNLLLEKIIDLSGAGGGHIGSRITDEEGKSPSWRFMT